MMKSSKSTALMTRLTLARKSGAVSPIDNGNCVLLLLLATAKK
jgi:hypothetical protein